MYDRMTRRPSAWPKDPTDYYLRRRQGRLYKARQASGAVPTLEEIADRENLYRTFQRLKAEAGQAPGMDGVTYRMIGNSEAGDLAGALSRSILEGRYRPGPSKIVQIPKANGKMRELNIRNIMDRVAASALDKAFQPFWEPVFLDSSYGFRPGRSTSHVLKTLDRDIRQSNRYILVQADIKDAFPNVPNNAVIRLHQQYITEPRLLAFIDTILRGGDSTKDIGIDQGNPYSPAALNVLLHHVHDVPLAQVMPYVYRYADNLVYLCSTPDEANEILAKVRLELNKVGFTLKCDNPVDLRTDTAQLLGFTISAAPEGLEIGLGTMAWIRLEQALTEAHKAIDPTQAALRAIRGWINAFGPGFDDGRRDPAKTEILGIGTAHGFTDVIVPEDLGRDMEDSYRRWSILRGDSQKKESPMGSEESSVIVAAPPATILPDGV